MKLVQIIIGVGIVAVLIAWYMYADRAMAPQDVETAPTEEVIEIPPPVEESTEEVSEEPEWPFEAKPDLIKVTSVGPGDAISSPLTIAGEARGYWFFEASFPIVLTNWDGLIIAEGVATAESDWMTEDFVPFTANLEFVSPYEVGDPDFMKRGSLILHRDNPSGLPENDDALEIPIVFAPAS